MLGMSVLTLSLDPSTLYRTSPTTTSPGWVSTAPTVRMTPARGLPTDGAVDTDVLRSLACSRGSLLLLLGRRGKLWLRRGED